jgi:hypothetical protein
MEFVEGFPGMGGIVRLDWSPDRGWFYAERGGILAMENSVIWNERESNADEGKRHECPECEAIFRQRLRAHGCQVCGGGMKAKVRGDELSRPVYFQNKQWAVTDYGIERADGTYPIEAERLGEARHNSGLPNWPIHMADKEWCDRDLFMDAFLRALVVHDGRYIQRFRKDWYVKTADRLGI